MIDNSDLHSKARLCLNLQVAHSVNTENISLAANTFSDRAPIMLSQHDTENPNQIVRYLLDPERVELLQVNQAEGSINPIGDATLTQKEMLNSLLDNLIKRLNDPVYLEAICHQCCQIIFESKGQYCPEGNFIAATQSLSFNVGLGTMTMKKHEDDFSVTLDTEDGNKRIWKINAHTSPVQENQITNLEAFEEDKGYYDIVYFAEELSQYAIHTLKQKEEAESS